MDALPKSELTRLTSCTSASARSQLTGINASALSFRGDGLVLANRHAPYRLSNSIVRVYGAWDRIDERAGLGVFIERLDPNDAAIVDNRGESPKVGTVLVALHVTQLALWFVVSV